MRFLVGNGVAGVLKVGPQPHSIKCFVDVVTNKRKAVVSNAGDNSLAVVDVDARTVITTIPMVPASRAFHGITVLTDVPSLRQYAVVAGTDANVLTVVDLNSLRVLTQIPVDRPTAAIGEVQLVVASATRNELILYDFPSFQVLSRVPNFVNVQDVVYSMLGRFATIGGQDSLTRWSGDPAAVPVSMPVGIPGPAALAASTFEYEISSLKPGTNRATTQAVYVSSPNLNRVFIILSSLFRPPLPALGADLRIANAGSFAGSQVAVGSLASAMGATGVNQAVTASVFGQPLPKTLGGVTLKVGGSLSVDTASNQWLYSPTGSVDAALHFVGPSQINFQVPTGIAPGTNIPAQLTKPDGRTLLTTFNIAPTAPGIFTLLMNGQGQAAALNADYSQNGNPQSIVGAKPAARGSMVQIYATGAGETDPPLLPGEPAPASGNPLVLTQVQPTVTIGGITARVLFSGMAPGWVGLWQINAVVPENVTPGSAVPLTITAGGVASNTVTIAVQ